MAGVLLALVVLCRRRDPRRDVRVRARLDVELIERPPDESTT